MKRSSAEKTAFVLSVALFAYLVGIATQAFGWFPSSLLQRAWNQAEAVVERQTDWLGDRRDVSWRPPRVFEETGVRTRVPEQMADGYTLIASHWEDFEWRPGLKLVDDRGRVVHRWWIEPGAPVEDSTSHRLRDVSLHGSHLLPGGDVVISLFDVALVRLDACSRVQWWRSVGAHHAVSRAEDGTFWIASRSDTVLDEDVTSVFRRSNLRKTNKVLHLAPDGRTLDRISVLGLLESEGLLRRLFTERWIRFGDGATIGDLTHLNDVEPLSASAAKRYPLFDAGDLLLSLKYPNLVLVIDPDTREVKWHHAPSHPVIKQHDPDFLGDGWIGIFDNAVDGTRRGHRLGGSRILAVQPSTDSVRTLFAPSDSAPFYSEWGGKWQRLDNGNLLLTEMATGRLLEVTEGGRVVWEWVHEGSDAETVPEVTEGTRYRLSRERIESWGCSAGDTTGTG